MHDDGRPGVRDEGIEAEARAAAAAVPAPSVGGNATTPRLELLAALPELLQAAVRPAATSPIRERIDRAAVLRDTPAWREAAPRWRAASGWLLCSFTVGDPPEDDELPRGVRDGIRAVLGGLDPRGGGWVDPADAPAPEAEPLPAAAVDWSVEPEARRWLVDGLIPAGRVSAVYGAGEVGKSRFLLQLAIAVIRDVDGPMLPTDPTSTGTATAAVAPMVQTHGRAVLLTWEDEVDEVRRRLRLATNAGAVPKDVTRSALEDRLQVIDMRAIGGPLWAPRADGTRHTSTEGEWTEAGRRLLALMERDRPALVTIDPVAAAYACSEVDRALVRRFVSSLDAHAEACGTTVILAGHPPKGDSAFSGSTDWRNAVRGMVTLGAVPTSYKHPKKPDTNKAGPVSAPSLTREKSSYGPHRDPIWLRSHWAGPDETHRPALAWFATDERAAALAVDPHASLTGGEERNAEAEAEDEFTIR